MTNSPSSPTGSGANEKPGWKPWQDGREVDAYTYCDAVGRRAFQVVRFEVYPDHPAAPDKKFVQRAYAPAASKAGQNGCPEGYAWGRKGYGIETMLYRLPNVRQQAEDGKTVFVVEGEKDVHTLEDAGFVATCNPQGAGSWRTSFSEALRGAHVAILPDNDEPGVAHAEDVASACAATAASVRVIELQGLPDGGDVTDWFEAGGDAAALRQLASETPTRKKGGDDATGEQPAPQLPHKSSGASAGSNAGRDEVKQRLTANGSATLIDYAKRAFGTDEGTCRENGEVRIKGNGGLLIVPGTGQWYNHSDHGGGDCLDLFGVARHGASWDSSNPEMFKDALRAAADFTDVELHASSQPTQAHTRRESGRGDAGEGFTLGDFREAVKGLDADKAEQKGDELAHACVEHLDRTEIKAASKILRDAGVTVREVDEWRRAVNQVQKEQERERRESSQRDKKPSELRGGALTQWIAERIAKSEAFARDAGGALYYYEGGCYHPDGVKRLRRRFREVLETTEVEEWSRHRRDEVEAWFRDGAPDLWEHPPSNRLCLENGILNLDTFELEEHGRRKWLSTTKTPIRYDPEAEGQAWEEYFASVLPEDAHRAGVGVELFARLLTPATGKRKAILFKGPRDTGKSQALRNLMKATGAGSNITRYSLQDLEQNRFAKARLFGKAANVNADLPAAPLEGTSVFKKITGGDDITGEHKHKKGFEFTPHCHLLFSSNHPVQIGKGMDYGAFWSRWVVLPFTNRIPEAEQMEADDLEEQLQDPQELSAMLNRALAVRPQVRESGITETRSMEIELERMKRADGTDEEPGEQGRGQSGDGHSRNAPTAPTPARPPASAGPQTKKKEEEKAARGGVCRNSEDFMFSQTPPEASETAPAEKQVPESSGDGHTSGDGAADAEPEFDMGAAFKEVGAQLPWLNEGVGDESTAGEGDASSDALPNQARGGTPPPEDDLQ